MDLDSDDENRIDEDYYAFLNVSKEAASDEISNAYRRLSRLYHPDKHFEPEQKKKAEALFNKTKRAYEILSDPHQRAIYDSLGIRGLETEGWEIVQRTKTPAEIRAEYEQLAQERADRRMQQSTNPRGTVTVNINATDCFNPYYDELDYDELDLGGPGLFPNIEVSGMNFSQSVEFPLTQRDTCTLSGQLQTSNGTGVGGVNLGWRRLFSHKGWIETEVGAGNGPTLSVKGFRTLSKRFFWNGGTILQFAPTGIRPGIMSTLAMQIDKYSVGYFSYRGGMQSLLSTSVVRDTEFGHYNFSLQFGLPHSYASLSYAKKMLKQELKLRIAFKIGTFGGLIEYGAEKKVSKHSNLSASVVVGMPTGVKLKIRLTRANQVYTFPVHLCEEIMPAPIFYATVVPLVVYIVVKKAIVEPFLKEKQQRKIEKQRENNRTRLVEKRREAEAAIDLMRATYSRIKNEEETKKGLIILKAVYGKTVEASTEIDEVESETIDVTVPLQCLVRDSKLVLHEQSKSQLPGFFDPCVGEDKWLHIQYKFHSSDYVVTINDNESLRIPKPSHRSNVT
ncbi:uncharacterized protein CBL_06521 [Carabus blaptoides fortunei]